MKKKIGYQLSGAITIAVFIFIFHNLIFKPKKAANVIQNFFMPSSHINTNFPEKIKRIIDHPVPSSVEPKEIKNILTSWVLRLGSFDPKSAEDLIKRLRKKGFSSYEQLSMRHDSQHIVFVGPDIDESFMKQQQVEIAKIFNIDGEIVEFKLNITDE